MQKLIIIVLALLIVSLQACVYRMDIAQGNRIDQDKLDQLKIGMTRSQVRLLIGEAAINDIHHPNQAHYVYYLLKGESNTTELKTMILTYDDNGVLTHIEGSL
jgi:outer membrane protein assembly factor BamE